MHSHSQPSSQSSRASGQFLPPELIAIIFFMIAEGDSILHEDHPSRRKEDILTFLSASQVCWYWREIALELPHLWGNLIFPDYLTSFQVSEFMERAGDAPLSVRSCSGREECLPRFAVPRWLEVLNALDRIKSLNISFDLEKMDEILPLELTVLNAAPNLQFCKMNCENYVEHDHNVHPYLINRTQPILLFQGNAQALRCLSIHSCILPPQADFSALSLTHLHLQMEGVSSFEPTLSEWLDILQSPSLELLTILGFRSKPSMSNNKRIIQLPRLESLYLDGSIIHCGDLFAALFVPPICAIYLEVDQFNPLEFPFDGLKKGLERFLARWDQYNGSRVYHWLLKTDDGELRLGVGDANTEDDPQLLIVYENFIDSDSPLEYFLQQVFPVFTNSPLMEREAFIRLRHGVHPDDDPSILQHIAHFLAHFHNATSIMLGSDSISNVLPHILLKSPFSTNENQRFVLLPRLKNIALENESGPGDKESLCLLKKYLQWRHQRSRAIPTVRLVYPELAVTPTNLSANDFYATNLRFWEGLHDFDQKALPVCKHCDGH